MRRGRVDPACLPAVLPSVRAVHGGTQLAAGPSEDPVPRLVRAVQADRAAPDPGPSGGRMGDRGLHRRVQHRQVLQAALRPDPVRAEAARRGRRDDGSSETPGAGSHRPGKVADSGVDRGGPGADWALRPDWLLQRISGEAGRGRV
uniref:(northern house mosquito) hypothetical protein n=1 Tax=Culex pipiens TaxID=7175 RepID=A0A8D8MUN3_CULPI